MPCIVKTYPMGENQFNDVNETLTYGKGIADSLTLSNDNLREHILADDTSKSDKFLRIGSNAIMKMDSFVNMVTNVKISLRYYDDTSNCIRDMYEAVEINKKLMKDFKFLQAIIAEGNVSGEELVIINNMQVEHRQEDVDRLINTFNELISQKNLPNSERDKFNKLLEATQNADVNKPLEPQLGFDPDEW